MPAYMDPFRKLCHSETRKLVLVIGIIISTVIATQLFLPPYENVLGYLFPADNEVLPAKNSSLAGDFSPQSVRTYNSPPLNHSSTSFPLVDGVVNKTSNEAFELGEETKNETTGDDGERNGSVCLPWTLPPAISQTNLSILKELHSGPAMSPTAGELGVPPTPPNAEKPGLLQTGPVILPPVAANAGLLQGVSVMMPPKAENPGLLQIAPAKPPIAENPQLLQSGPDTSNNKSSMSTTNIKKAMVKVPPKGITSLSEMNVLLLQSHASSHSKRPQWSSVPNQEILSVKSQIENAPMIKNDRELYAPLFRNASIFKKSYELMEQKLKVFIYREGARPIFHQPILDGIYASEGWFMKQMESNKHFVVKDPKKAHLFYLPFSSQILRYTLYVPDSHSRKNIVRYLKNYMSIITTKYPFWNRTGGADHFLVACHDWAPSETEKAMSGSIRALCNADINQAGFIMGKDVSLPETNVLSVSNPLKDLGGKPASKRTILAFFAGRAHGYLRQILLKHWKDKDPDMKIYNGTNTRVKSKNYIQYMKNSKYCICPKGYEVNSPRIVEAIFFECVPVIISDNFVPPFFNVLDWEAFAIFVQEKDIPKLKYILDSIPEQKYLKLQRRVKKVQQHFLWHTKPVKYDMFHMILHSIWYNRVFQI